MIPKVLHFMWWQGVGKMPANLSANIRRWSSLNPEYDVKVWSEDGVRDLAGRNYPEWASLFDTLIGSTPGAALIKRCDLARLMIVHAFGGIYLDCDLVPLTPLDQFFSSGTIYNRFHSDCPRLPDRASEDYVNKDDFEVILSREHCRIDSVGKGVANGVIIARQGCQMLLDFMTFQIGSGNGKALDFVGTWALTRFIRARLESIKGKLLIIPPHYFLWDSRILTGDPAPYTISLHPGENSWGDKSKAKWWEV